MSTGDLLTGSQLDTIGRVRRACTAAAVVGALASMAANMLASDGTAVGLAVGVIAPGAFILASEIAAKAFDLPRTDGTRLLRGVLLLLLLLIAGSAAVVSFGHIREVVHTVGESDQAEILTAMVVDEMAVMGLIGHHLTGVLLRRHQLATTLKAESDRLAAIAAERAAAEAAERARIEAERLEAEAAEAAERARLEAERLAVEEAARAEREAAEEADREARRAERAAARQARQEAAQAAAEADAPARRMTEVVGDDPSLAAPVRARRLAEANPELTQAEIGALIGRAERTVRRYLGSTEGRAEPGSGEHVEGLEVVDAHHDNDDNEHTDDEVGDGLDDEGLEAA